MIHHVHIRYKHFDGLEIYRHTEPEQNTMCCFPYLHEAMPVWGCNKKSGCCSSTRLYTRLRAGIGVDQYLNEVTGTKRDRWSAAPVATPRLRENSVVRTCTRSVDRSNVYRLCLKQMCQLPIALQKQEILEWHHHRQSIFQFDQMECLTRLSSE